VPSVFVAAGSNVRPEEHLSLALSEIERIYAPLRVSPAYRNRAVGFEGDDFINLVVGFETEDPIERVRERLQAVEAACGRPPGAPRWAPRTMDLDVLLYGDRVSDEPGLVTPRPDLVRRPYMLKPMVDLEPDLLHPTLGKTMKALWSELDTGDHEMAPVTIPRSGPRPPPGSGR
jgi:2-amino-4-hydroxy-6-hydroxymethyldihydropteridine diphosphokinase